MGRRDPEEKLVAPADFNGPLERRRCTDIFFSLLILAMWGAMSYLGYVSFTEGDYRVVVNPLDYDGNICGIKYNDTDMREYPYLYYVNFLAGGVCVKECPDLTPKIASNATDSNATTTDDSSDFEHIDPFTLVTFGGVYQLDGFSTSKREIIQVANYTADGENFKACTASTCFPDNDPLKAYFSDDGINQGYGYAFYLLDTVEFLNRCFPTVESFQKIQNVTGDTFIDIEELQSLGFYERFYGDCWRAKEWILGFGFCVALVSFPFYEYFFVIIS